MAKAEVHIDDKLLAILQAEADDREVTLGEILTGDRSAKDIARDKLHQALSREIQEGRIPQVLLDSVLAFSAKLKEERNQAKAKAVV